MPIYVLEYLLGQYCNSDDEEIINRGVETVKSILSNNYVRPDEAQKVLSQLRQKGSHTVIDMITVSLNMKDDYYEAEFSNLGLTRIPISEEYPEGYDRLLCGGIWCIVQLEYGADDMDDFGIVDSDGAKIRSKKSKQKDATPISIRKLTPIQMPHVDMDGLKEGRKQFSKEEWLDILLRSTGMEPDELTYREKWLFLTRMIPLVENNFNLCELGPRSTGKSHLYKEISPNSILVSGGQTTVANLFYNMGRRTMGLVGLWDVVAFDEVAGINFKDKDGIQIMKDYMASGSFARGKEEKAASASMVFVGNINQSVDVLLKTSSLFDPYKTVVNAAIDRINSILYLGRTELQCVNGNFYVTEIGKTVSVSSTNIKLINVPYVRSLRERCEEDFLASNYDSVITKSRTLMEEVLIYVLEENKVVPSDKGDLNVLYNQVKTLYGMQQLPKYDKRINSMLGGLEKIVSAVCEMRNNDSDAHGAGSRRINIRDYEARLTMNSAITFCEYYLDIDKHHRGSRV